MKGSSSAWFNSAQRLKAETLIRTGNTKEALVLLDAIGTIQSKVRASVVRSTQQSKIR